MSQRMMMKCRICGKEYPIDDPIRRTCGNHSEKHAKELIQSGSKFLYTITRNFQNPNYQNHSLGIFDDDEGQRYYSTIWWGF